MSFDEETLSTTPKVFRFSPLWDFCVPMSIAAVPAIIFTLIGFITQGFHEPSTRIPAWLMTSMVVLEVAGIVAMAVVVLVRSDFRMNQLSTFTNGNPATWRKRLLFVSMIFLLLFDVIFNVAAGFGAGSLITLAIPMFIGYLVCIRIAFARL